MGSSILVRKRKYDGSVRSEWEGELLISAETDWLSVMHHPVQHKKLAPDGTLLRADLLFIRFFKKAYPLTILMGFDENGAFNHAKCDASLPYTQHENVIEFIDLDLDVIVNADLSIYVQDEEEFERHRIAMRYPETAVQQAHNGIALAKSLLKQRSFPFDRHSISNSYFH